MRVYQCTTGNVTCERCCVADRNGAVLDNPPLPEEICEDPVLSALKLVAWSGDDSLLPRAGERGFPHWATWMQRNTRFSRDAAAFISGVPAAASGFATRSHPPAPFACEEHAGTNLIAGLRCMSWPGLLCSALCL